MADEFQEIAGLRHVSMRVAGSWVEKTVTTDPPRYVPHTEYALVLRVECDVELLLAVMLVDAGKGQFGKQWRSAARCEWEIRLSFFPLDWRRTEAVRVNFEGLTTTVEHADLKSNLRPFVATRLVNVERIVASGSILTVASIDAGRRIDCSIVAVAKADTDSKRGRWALKPELSAGLPTAMRFLLSGATAGRF